MSNWIIPSNNNERSAHDRISPTGRLPGAASRLLVPRLHRRRPRPLSAPGGRGTRSEERRVGKSVDLGGRRIIKKKKNKNEKGRRKKHEARKTVHMDRA